MEPSRSPSVKRQARIALVVLVHHDNAERYLAECLAALAAQTYPSDRFTLFIVSNGVAEESRILIERLAVGARTLHHKENLGWSGGNNAAIRIALEEPFEYLVMLNINAVAEKDWLRALAEAAERSPTVHVLQSAILLHGTSLVHSLGNRIHYLGYGYCHQYGEEQAASSQRLAVDYASGAAMLVKREVFEAIGLFREDYFAYYDDLEFCWRARLAGYNVGLAPASVCYHRYAFHNTLACLYWLQRNRLMTLLTLERIGTIGLTLPCLLVSELVVGAYLAARGWGDVQWRVARHFLKPQTWDVIREGRRAIRRLRRRRDAEIVKRFAGRIVFAEADHPALRYVFNPLLSLYWALVRRLIVW